MLKNIMQSGWFSKLYYVGNKIWSTNGIMLNEELEIMWKKDNCHRFVAGIYLEDKHLYIYNRYYEVGFINESLGISCLDLETGEFRWNYTPENEYKILSEAIRSKSPSIIKVNNILAIDENYVYTSSHNSEWCYKINIDNGELEYIEDGKSRSKSILNILQNNSSLQNVETYGYDIEPDIGMSEVTIFNTYLNRKIKVKIEFDNISIDNFSFRKEGYHFNKGGQILANDYYIYFFAKPSRKNKYNNSIMFRFCLESNKVDEEIECPFNELPIKVYECFDKGILLDINDYFYYKEGVNNLYKYTWYDNIMK